MTLNITFLQLCLTVISTVLPVVVLAWAIIHTNKKQFKMIYDDKANKEITQIRIDELHKKISLKADRTELIQMSSKIDMIYDIVKNK